MQPNINYNPAQQHHPQPVQPQYSPPAQTGGTPGKSSKLPWIILIVVILVVAGVLAYLFRDKFTSQTGPKLSGYQAVFLTNGQVYFGHLSHAGSQYATLTDIFYLQVNQPLQTGQSGANGSSGTAAQQATAAQNANSSSSSSSSSQQPQLSLVKLGNELHGPADLMHLNRDQILFYEDLKADGKVAQAIAAYYQNQKNPQQSSDNSGAQGSQGSQGSSQAQQPSAPATGTQAPAKK